MKQLNLSRGTLMRLEHQPLLIKILSGEIWITRSGDITDYILLPTDEVFKAPMNPSFVIEALEDSVFQISDHYSGQEKEVRTTLHLLTERSIADEDESTRPASAR